MDPLVVVDAVAECMAYEEKELCKIGNIAILIMFKVAGKWARRYYVVVRLARSHSESKLRLKSNLSEILSGNCKFFF